jgi:hypothetical protein
MHVPQDDLVALAAALTGLLAIPLAILTFFFDRALRESRTLDGLRVPTGLAAGAAACTSTILVGGICGRACRDRPFVHRWRTIALRRSAVYREHKGGSAALSRHQAGAVQ